MVKQILYGILLALIAFGTSCNKSFTCQCKHNTTGAVIYEGTLKSYSEHTAKPQCEAKGASTSVTCALF